MNYRKKENYRKTTGFLIAGKFRDRFTVLPGPFHRGKPKTRAFERDRFTVEKHFDFLCPVESFGKAGPFHHTRSEMAPAAGEMMRPSLPLDTFIWG